MSTGPLNSSAPTTATLIGGVYNVASPAPLDKQELALQLDINGNLLVNIAAGGGAGGVQYADGTTNATPTGTVALGKNPSNILHALGLSAAGNLNVNLAEGSISGGNAAASPTGAAVPASADYLGVNIAGNLVGVTGFSLTNSKAAATAIVDGSGNQITSFGGGTQFADNAASGATPTGTLSMGWDSVNSKVRALKVDANQNLDVTVQNASIAVTGTFFQGTQPVSIAAAVDVSDRSARLLGHVTVDNASLAVTGTFFQATQPVSIAAAVDVSDRAARLLGHVTVDNATLAVTESGLWNVNQAIGVAGFEKITDGTNTAAVKAASTAAVATDPALVVAISPNNSVAVTGTFFQATQPVSGTVFAKLEDGLGNAITSDARGGERPLSVQILDASGNQIVSFGGTGGNAAASATAAAVPGFADYEGINISGNLTGRTGFSLGSQVAASVAIVDGSGNQITSFGGSALPPNASQETGGNLSTLVTQTRSEAQIIDLLTMILANERYHNQLLASTMNTPGESFDVIESTYATI